LRPKLREIPILFSVFCYVDKIFVPFFALFRITGFGFFGWGGLVGLLVVGGFLFCFFFLFFFLFFFFLWWAKQRADKLPVASTLSTL